MNQQQLKESIEECTQAISIIMNIKGFGYNHSADCLNIIINQRKQFQKELHELELEERKANRKEVAK